MYRLTYILKPRRLFNRMLFFTGIFVCFFFCESFTGVSNSADRIITGKVTEPENGQPLASVTVQVKGKNIATKTNADGYFSISANETSILVFSYIGYKTEEVKVGNQITINIQMQQSLGQLNDVVVTALGIKKERRSLGYSVSEVAGSSLTKNRDNNVMNTLEGRVPGVNVSGVQTGPGGSANVVIRGASSITGSSQPLYVIDGVPITNSTYRNPDADGYGGSDGGDGIGNINPDDIESISILKGAAASALYGYRGSKGVILITTKSGKKGQGLGIDLNSNTVVESVIDNTDFQTEYGQGYGGFKPINQADAIGSGMNSWGAKLDGTDIVQFDGVARPYSAQPGNIKRFYKNGLTSTNTIAFSKGFGDAGSIRFSASDLYQTSIVPNAGLKRQSFDLNAQYNLDKHFSLQLKANYILQHVKNEPNVSDAPGNMNFAVMFLPPNVNIVDLAPGYTANGYENPFLEDEFTTNPYFSAYKFINDLNRHRFIGLADLKYTFNNGLYLQFRTGEDYFTDKTFNVTPTGTLYEIDGGMYQENYTSSELNIDGIAGKDFKITKDVALSASAGVTYRKASQEIFGVYGSSFAIPFLYNVANLKGTGTYDAKPVVVNKSVYGSLDFSYKNYLYLSVTGRNDWYSTLAPGKINYLYPSVSASFVYSELMHIPNMDYGKLRLSYADVGGEADDPYQTFLTYNIVATINGLPIGNISNGAIPNNNLRPSSAKEFEFGTEVSFYKTRLKFDISVYHKKITNSIIPATTSETSGYTGALLNLGNLRNNGIEVLITGTPFIKRNFDWTIIFNGTYNNNKVLALASDADNLLLSNSRAGEDDGQQAYIAQIVGKPAAQIVALDPKRDKDGNIIINPRTGAPSANSAIYTPFGSGIDPWEGGITNDIVYKNFNLSFLIDGKFGGKIFSGTNYYAYQLGLSKETLAGRDERYGTDSLYPQDYYTRLSVINSKFIYNASFIKLRQISLGYNLPKKWLHNKFQQVSLSIVARNVLTLMKHTPNIDPESNYTNGNGQGLELAGVPYSRTYGVNLSVKL